jgi:hypothetical protein
MFRACVVPQLLVVPYQLLDSGYPGHNIGEDISASTAALPVPWENECHKGTQHRHEGVESNVRRASLNPLES